MTLHFAYGSNMNRGLMRAHAPGAEPLGVARLGRHRLVIMRSGYASVEPDAGALVLGVLWRLTLRDVAVLNAYESLAAGLYRAARRPVLFEGRRHAALVYIGNGSSGGVPKPGYMEAVIAAAQDWCLPQRYVGALRRLAPGRGGHARAKDVREIEWPQSAT